MYFDHVPSDLLPLLLSYNSSTTLYELLPQLVNIKVFQKILTPEPNVEAKIFWENVWRRDISSFMELPDNPYMAYMEIFSDLNSKRIGKFAVKGYDILCYSMINDNDTYERVMIPAIKYKYKSMIYKLLETPIWTLNGHYNQIMTIGANHGHLDLVKWAIEHGANDYEKAMAYASAGGHIKIIELMMNYGAHNYNLAMLGATLGGCMNTIELMLQLGVTDYNTCMKWAAERGHCEIVKKMLELGATTYIESLDGAACYGHKDVIKFIFQHITTNNISLNLTNALQEATKRNHIETVQLLLTYKSQNQSTLNGLLYLATRFNYKNLVKLLLDHGASDFMTARTIANNKGYSEIVNLIDQYMN